MTKVLDLSSWEEKSAALLRAFQRLPIVDPAPGSTGIPYRFFLGDIPRQLMLMRPTTRRKTSPDKDGLHNLAQLTGRTVKVLEGLSDNARTALNLNTDTLTRFEFTLRILHGNAKMAKAAPRLGSPKKTQAPEIANVVAQHFYGLTGRKAPAAPFAKLLASVFDILGVDASAASQAKSAGKRRKFN